MMSVGSAREGRDLADEVGEEGGLVSSQGNGEGVQHLVGISAIHAPADSGSCGPVVWMTGVLSSW